MRNQTTKSIIISGEVPALYQAWLDFGNHPQFMEHITSVKQEGFDTYRWVRKGPLDTRLEWTTKVTRAEPNKRIAWKTVEGDLKTSGQVTFTGLPRQQVEVTLTTQTVPPDNPIDKVTTALFAETQLEKDLRNFKAFMENR